jgi:hypothetical protein
MQPNNNLRPLRVWTAAVPKEGPATVPYLVDFTIVQAANIDLSQLFNNAGMSIVQAVFADNSANASPLYITIPDTQQKLCWPAYSQGYLPCLQTTNFKFVAQSAGGVIVPIQFLNFNVAPMVWSVNGQPLLSAGGGLQVSDAILEGAVSGGVMQTAITGSLSYIARSGTITTGGSVQQLMAANAGRKALQIQNISTGDLWYSFTGNAAVGGANNSFKLVAGAYYESAPGLAPNSAITIIGATTGQAFSAQEA